ncbi:MAG: alanine:cation symporter family protein [Bradymonadaceae bacterium]|nr:alanine:cation symporter family protein [Lujinxingiaceae bacterium]
MAGFFAVLCIGGSFGGGNMFQSNQSFQAITQIIPWLGGERASGEVRLTASTPQVLDYRRHLVRFEVAADRQLDANAPAPSFLPIAHLLIGVEDWRADNGRYVIDIPVQAADAGPDYDAAVRNVTVLQLGTVVGRNVEWSRPDNITAANVAPIGGGVPNRAWLYGMVLAALVGLVIIGGIKSIGNVASKIVPAMCIMYVLAALWILVVNFTLIPQAIWVIVSEAFQPAAGLGGMVGVFIQGVRRAAFSNEAGVGSAAIAHSAAKTNEPVREGLVALLEPFIDTLIVCFMTGIVVVITGVYADPATAGLQGVELTSAAFETVIWWFPYILSLAVVLFAFSTMISWSYYGERCWTFLFGADQSMTYRAIFLFFVWLGAVSSLSNVLDFSDLMILSMAFPNILGVIMLSKKVSAALNSYWARHRAGEFD